MALKKITVAALSSRSFVAEKRPGFYGTYTFADGHKIMEPVADTLAKIAGMLCYANTYPDTPARTLIGTYFGPIEVTERKLSKTRRSYSIPYLTITEED